MAALVVFWLLKGPLDEGAVGKKAPSVSPASGLTGQFLVATPQLTDPRFSGSVIYMIADDGGGAMGLMVNRLLGQGPLATLLSGFGIAAPKVTETVELYYGGPVMPRKGFVLHGSDYAGPGTHGVTSDIFLSTDADVLRAMAAGTGPRQRRVILGYAGWAPGQLDAEIARGDWLTASAGPAFVFDPDPQTLWARVYRHAGRAM